MDSTREVVLWGAWALFYAAFAGTGMIATRHWLSGNISTSVKWLSVAMPCGYVATAIGGVAVITGGSS